MNLELLKAGAASNQWIAILPELLMGCLALFLLVLEILLPKKRHDVIPSVAIAGQLAILIAVIVNCRSGFVAQESFNGLLRHTANGQAMRIFFLLTSILVSVLGVISLAKQRMPR